MKFNNSDIDRLFSSKKIRYCIPDYQRAYAWEEANWETFLNDLLESLQGNNNYFYGNILLEDLPKDKYNIIKRNIIDGQQRLTTVIIFVRALINVLEKREISDESLPDISDIKSSYLIYKSKVKFQPVYYDQLAWEEIIINNNNEAKTISASQQRYKNAKKYFETRLSAIDTKSLKKIFEKLSSSEVNEIILEGNKEAALMFELQNNRGKDLTDMEKIKSFFMYKVYSNTDSGETKEIIKKLSTTFENIYRVAADIDLHEDSILIYHNNAYLNGYKYRGIEHIKQKLASNNDSLINWIQDYSRELLQSFLSIKSFESDNFDERNQLKKLKTLPAWAWAFILKGYKYYENDLITKKKYLSLLEKLIFRSELESRRAKIQEKLGPILLDFKGDFNDFQSKISSALNNDTGNAHYWSKTQMKHTLQGDMYGNKVLNYILWEYEKSIQDKGYKLNHVILENEQIEHISPKVEPKVFIESGYQIGDSGTYDDEFKEKYINNIGNLMLISGSHNASIGNRPFSDKLASYNKHPLLNQQAQLKEFVDDLDHPFWGKIQIEQRAKSIIDFAMERWSIE